METLTFIIVLAVLGLSLGSFANALVWRLHTQPQTKSLKLKAKDLSMLHGRSMCVHCHHVLTWYDLLPVVSWLSLGGKCRYCKKPISVQYPLVEILTAALFVMSYMVWPNGFDGIGATLFVFWLVLIVGFMAMFVYDLRWMILPDRLTYPLIALAGLQVVIHSVWARDFSIIVGSVMGLVVVGGLFYVLFQISDGKWIGGGDVKLGFILGLLAGGIIEGMLLIFIASLLGTLTSIPLIAKKGGLKKRIPFGPLLITATIFVYLFGQNILDWYQNQIFLI